MIDQVRTGTTPRLKTARASASPGPVADKRSQVMPSSAARETGEEQRSFGQWHNGGGIDLPSFDEPSAEQLEDSDAGAGGLGGVTDEPAESESAAAARRAPGREKDSVPDPEAMPMSRSVADGLRRLMEEATRGASADSGGAGRRGGETQAELRTAGLFVKAAGAYGLQGALKGRGAGLRPGMVFSSKY